MHQKIVYILPFYEEGTDTHLFYNYELIKAAADWLDIFVIIEKCPKLSVGQVANALKARCYIQRFKNPILRFLELLFLCFKLRVSGYKNFYTHYSYFGALASWLASRFWGRAFYWNRGMPWLFKRKFFEECVFQFILRHSILVTSPESLAKEYQKLYGVKKYKILSNWIDTERFYPDFSKEASKEKLGLDKNKKIILFVHHLSERKGADFINKTAELLGANFELIVIGDGSYRPRLEEEIKKSGSNVKILGALPNKEVVKYFQAADVFFMPSREEGQPHVILEAIASGTPFVASDVGGIKEMIPPSFFEFLCRAGDIDCFSNKIKKLLSNNEFYEGIRKEGLSFASTFGKNTAVEEFTNLFK